MHTHHHAADPPRLSDPAALLNPRQRIRQLLVERLRSPEFAPRVLPQTALKLVEVARDPEVSLENVTALIEQEPVLAGDVLTTARSVVYSRGNPVESLDEALVRLGIPRVAGIFMEAAMRATALNNNVYEAEMEQLRRHMTAAGHIARGICRIIGRPGERAFLCGLLHDVGTAAAFNVLAELPKQERPTDSAAIRDAILDVHEEAAGVIGLKWNLPWATHWVVSHHHQYWVDGRISPLAALTGLACWLASSAGARALEDEDDESAEMAMHHFELEGAVRSRLQDSCRRIVEQIA